MQVRAPERRIALPAPRNQVVLQLLAGTVILFVGIGIHLDGQSDLFVLRQGFPKIAQ